MGKGRCASEGNSKDGAACLSVSSGDGAFRDPAGCCAHGTRGIRRGLCIWPEHRNVLAATLVGWARGRECGSINLRHGTGLLHVSLLSRAPSA